MDIFRAVVLLGAFALAPVTAALAQSEYVRVDISSLPLADALTEFAEQAKLSIGETGVNFGRGRMPRSTGPTSRRKRSGAYYRAAASRSNPWMKIRYGSKRHLYRARTPRLARPRSSPELSPNAARNQPRHPVLDRRDQRTPARGFRCQTSHELTTQVAGLTATNLGSGRDKLFVRGLTTDSVLPGLSEPVVGVYLDEVANCGRRAGPQPAADSFCISTGWKSCGVRRARSTAQARSAALFGS